MKKTMNKINFFYIAFVLVIILIPMFFLNEHPTKATNELFYQKNQLILILLVIYPIVCLLSGTLCYILKGNLSVMMLITIMSLIYVMVKYFGMSDSFYVLIYTLIVIASYKLSQVIDHYKPNKK